MLYRQHGLFSARSLLVVAEPCVTEYAMITVLSSPLFTRLLLHLPSNIFMLQPQVYPSATSAGCIQGGVQRTGSREQVLRVTGGGRPACTACYRHVY